MSSGSGFRVRVGAGGSSWLPVQCPIGALPVRVRVRGRARFRIRIR